MMRRVRWVAVACLIVTLAAACGQKAGVAGTAVAGGEGGVSSGAVAGDAGAVTGDTSGATAAGPAAGGAVAGGTGAAGGGAVAGGAAATPRKIIGGGSGNQRPDKEGVTADSIVVGIHAPVTGAAPFPQTSFNNGKSVYFDFVNKHEGGILGGKKLKVVFEDDEYNPVTAKQKCQKMVEQDHAFILIGGGGADQITACAQYANSVGVPYFSAGVNEAGLLGLHSYFAISESYSQQSNQVAQYIKNKFAKTKVGVVVAETPSFDDARTSVLKALQANGLNVVVNDRINKNADQNQSQAEASKLCDASKGIEIVYVLTSPETFINLAASINSQPPCAPKFIGPGITSGLNEVAAVLCGGTGTRVFPGAIFFSPFPQTDAIDSMDPQYNTAYGESNNGQKGDDIGIALWGLEKNLRLMFQAVGPSLGRAGLISLLESGKQFTTGVYPPVQYSASSHLGSTQVHVLEATCTPPAYTTKFRFASAF
jgi:ABC-type branched-subunit amino acid transport system substrate-binding protein